ncbi:PLP-dependent transferase [Morchella conica CCBAS932]|uniref:Molybdenum cofactor sulfurase n=1 Tax=Morchella conica CCBAS932 TaxID=1392247 RepID=A0A3N4KQP9_9PEZI|nr:PLP-dependent transferase [Morchella conica CCBAS932]
MDPSRDSILQGAVSLGYNPHVEELRTTEYPQLKDITYLDHAGTTLYATSLIHAFSSDLCSNIYGNPHSPSPSSQQTTKRIDDIRLRVLRLFNADPEEFDVVFCANATAGMKLVLEAFTAQPEGFRYRYHIDAHTSLVGIRELAKEATCYTSDAEVELWLRSPCEDDGVGLFGWPAQSNFTGRRLPQDWAGRVRKAQSGWYSLLDAAALVTTSLLNLRDSETAPDFTVLSFYKMFGFPDLGALIVRRASAGILKTRGYFGGGTVDAVVGCGGSFNARKEDSPHSHLEDGTSAFHSILALDAAITTHERLYGDYGTISRHAFSLVAIMYDLLSNLRHGNGRKLCQIYSSSDYKSPLTQGPIIAFNMQRADGTWVGYAEVEKLASVKNIHLRTGGLCNPGGIEQHVGLAAWEIEQNYLSGHRCWDDQDVMRGKPTGAIRISLGAMSTVNDLLVFLRFLEEFYVDHTTPTPAVARQPSASAALTVENLTIYPIKSCGGYSIPASQPWELRPHGLAWDREWCLVHLGTGAAIDQKRYPRMALIRPSVDLKTGMLHITIHNHTAPSSSPQLSIPLSCTPEELHTLHPSPSRVCGDKITALTYSAQHIVDFFTAAVGVPCTLARFPATSGQRHFKPHLGGAAKAEAGGEAPIGLSNESPILLVHRASVDALNAAILCTGGKAARADVFRANIVVRGGAGAYAEDRWAHVKVGGEFFEVLGACRRCHMVCVDQETAVKNEEPYVTLAKSRRVGGRVVFGVHMKHLAVEGKAGGVGLVRVGEAVKVWEGGE